MLNQSVPHPLVGATRTYRADLPAYDAATDDAPGTLVVGNGMTVTVLAAYADWNGVAGLTMLYVRCSETGLSTHVTPSDLGEPTDAERAIPARFLPMPDVVPASWPTAGIVDARAFRIGDAAAVHKPSHVTPSEIRAVCGATAPVGSETDAPAATWADSYPTCEGCVSGGSVTDRRNAETQRRADRGEESTPIRRGYDPREDGPATRFDLGGRHDV